MTTEPQEPRCTNCGHSRRVHSAPGTICIAELHGTRSESDIECNCRGWAAPVAQEPPVPTEWVYGTKCPDCTSVRPPHHQRWCKQHPGSAQEPADPPQWLEEAYGAAMDVLVSYGVDDEDNGCALDVVDAALPILRAGIEQELREKVAAQIDNVPSHMLSVPAAARIVRGQS